MTLADEFRTRNWSIYAQCCSATVVFYLLSCASPMLTLLNHRSGILSMIVCFAIGLANIIMLWRVIIALFAALCLVSSFVILFIEVPLLLRICPTSDKFDNFIRRFATNYTRAAVYFIMSLIQWLSCIKDRTSLIAAAIFLLLTSIFYLIAGLRKDQFMSSKTLGGAGVAQMIV